MAARLLRSPQVGSRKRSLRTNFSPMHGAAITVLKLPIYSVPNFECLDGIDALTALIGG